MARLASCRGYVEPVPLGSSAPRCPVAILTLLIRSTSSIGPSHVYLTSEKSEKGRTHNRSSDDYYNEQWARVVGSDKGRHGAEKEDCVEDEQDVGDFARPDRPARGLLGGLGMGVR